MRLFIALVNLPRTLVLGPWAWLWTWTYPLSRPAIDEVRANARPDGLSASSIIETASLFIHMPFMARSQHYAERSNETESAISASDGVESNAYAGYLRRWRVESLWRTRLRELLVWSTFASWFVGWGSIEASFIFTGNFLFETHETPEAAGYVSNYFKVAALLFIAPFAWIMVGLATLRVTGRKA